MSIDRPIGATPHSGGLELPGALRWARGGPARIAQSSRLGLVGLAAVVAGSVAVSIAATGTDSLRPQSDQAPGAIPVLDGPLGASHVHFPAGFVLGVLVLLFAGYVLTVRSAAGLSPRTVLLAVAAVNAVVLLAPPLLSTDVFSYETYARMWQTYSANPYLRGPNVMPNFDTLYPFIGERWIATPTTYGPLFTALSGLLGLVTGGFGSYGSIAAGAFAFKGLAALGSLATVAFVWHAARLRGLNPVKAAALVGLNPLIVVYGVGGGHNDLIMLALTTAGLWAVLAHRERTSGATIVLGAAVKLTGLILLPFALLSGVGLGARRRHKAILIGAGLAGLASLAVGAALFGAGPLHLPHTLQQVQSEGANSDSISGYLLGVHSLHGVGHVVSLAFAAAFLGVCGWLLLRVGRGQMDWIDGAGWATLAMLLSASSVLPWYVSWLIPLAALGTDRRLTRAALWLTCLMGFVTMFDYLPHPVLGF